MSRDPCLIELSAIQKYLDDVSDHIREGHMPNIFGLERRVEKLCMAIESADDKVQKACLDALPHMLKQISICENDMRRLHAVQTVAASGHKK
jgi:hypothetical protein